MFISLREPLTLPITPTMREILEHRCLGLGPDDQLFKGVSAEHVHSMAMRLESPRFMLHDLRKLVAIAPHSEQWGHQALPLSVHE